MVEVDIMKRDRKGRRDRETRSLLACGKGGKGKCDVCRQRVPHDLRIPLTMSLICPSRAPWRFLLSYSLGIF